MKKRERERERECSVIFVRVLNSLFRLRFFIFSEETHRNNHSRTRMGYGEKRYREKNFGYTCRTVVASCGGHMARREEARRDSGVTGVSRKVLTVNSFPGGMRLESARRGCLSLPRSPPQSFVLFRPCPQAIFVFGILLLPFCSLTFRKSK